MPYRYTYFQLDGLLCAADAFARVLASRVEIGRGDEEYILYIPSEIESHAQLRGDALPDSASLGRGLGALAGSSRPQLTCSRLSFTLPGSQRHLSMPSTLFACPPPSTCLRTSAAIAACPRQFWYRQARSLRNSQRAVVQAARFENRELLVGDCTSLLSFCLYKQVKPQSAGLDFRCY